MKKLIFYLFAGLLLTACGVNEDSDKGIQGSLPGSQTLISTMDFYFPRNPNEEREFIELSYDKQHRLSATKKQIPTNKVIPRKKSFLTNTVMES